jgi:S1-C subfamily serine protease
MKRVLPIVLAAAVAGGLVGGLIGLALDGNDSAPSVSQPAEAAPLPTASSSASPAGNGLTPEAIYKSDAPGVVVITDTQTQNVPATPFTPPGRNRVRALGSGFVLDKQGDIATNDHVVQGATAIRVGFSDGASYPATIVGTDPSTDIAVVRVNAPASALHPLAFESSSVLAVGDPVYAIGNPFGLDRTMTAGIVSAVGREIEAPNGLTIPNAIQTDAPINHGNSGGPLLNTEGAVIGVNSQIENSTGGGNVGIGFAVPINTVKEVVSQIIENGRVEHAYLGVRMQALDENLARTFRLPVDSGVLVIDVVEGSPADKAGLQGGDQQVIVGGTSYVLGGDIVTAADGQPLAGPDDLRRLIMDKEPGDAMTLEVHRGDRGESERTVSVTLGRQPAEPSG